MSTTDATTETLETADAIEPSEAGSAPADLPTSPPASPDAPRSRWGDIASELSESLPDDDDAPPTAPDDASEPETPPDEAEAEKPESDAPPATAARSARFEVVGSDGKAVPLPPLPDGAKITFKADGKQVEVSSLDELVQHAQQGVNANRVRSEFGQVQRQLAQAITERDDAAGRITTAEQRADAAEDVLHQILTDPDKYDEVVRTIGPTVSPESREAARLRADIARRDAADQRRLTEQQQAGYQQFLTASHDAAADAIADRETFPFLTDADASEAVDLFVGLYQRTLAELTEQYRPTQARLGMSDEEFRTAVTREAQSVLTTDNLRLVLEKLNARYETRLRPHLAQRDADSAAAEARRHNDTTTERLARRDASRTLRRPSAPPATGDPAPEAPARPRNFAEHMAGIRRTLHEAVE